MKQNDDDDVWFDALAGRGQPLATSETVREALMMRDAILEMHAPTQAPAGEQAGLARLSARLAAEGLLDQPTAAPSSGRPWLALAAMLVVGAGVLLMAGQLLPDPARDDGAGLRGHSPVQPVLVDGPAAAAATLTTQLAKLGVKSTTTELGDAIRVEAFVPPHLEPQVNAMLAPYGARVGNNGHLLLSLQGRR